MRKASFPGLSSGFSLVDIMVGMVIGLLAILAIMQSYAAFEGQKRTTTSGMEAQENGLIALHALETDIRQGGYGLTSGNLLACTSINTYYSGTTTTGTALLPVQIIDGGTGSDKITPLYSTSAVGGVPARIVKDMPSSSSVLTVNTGNGFKAGDLVLIATPGSTDPCTRLAMTSDPQPTGNGVDLLHNSGQGQGPYALYNPPNSTELFPQPNGYKTSPQAVVFDMGTMSQNQFEVGCNNTLLSTNLTLYAAPNLTTCTSTSAIPANTIAISSNIVSIQAQYGIATTGTQSVSCWVNATSTGNSCESAIDWSSPPAADVARIKAIRLAVVARSSLAEKPDLATGTCKTTTSKPTWYGGSIDVSGSATNWQCYRYKVYQTIIPLRNILWAKM